MTLASHLPALITQLRQSCVSWQQANREQFHHTRHKQTESSSTILGTSKPRAVPPYYAQANREQFHHTMHKQTESSSTILRTNKPRAVPPYYAQANREQSHHTTHKQTESSSTILRTSKPRAVPPYYAQANREQFHHTTKTTATKLESCHSKADNCAVCVGKERQLCSQLQQMHGLCKYHNFFFFFFFLFPQALVPSLFTTLPIPPLISCDLFFTFDFPLQQLLTGQVVKESAPSAEYPSIAPRLSKL